MALSLRSEVNPTGLAARWIFLRKFVSEAGIMIRLPRIVPSFFLALGLLLPAAVLRADDTAPASGSDVTSADQPSLADQVDNFWHYGKIARYDLAADAGQKILASGADPRAILEAFEAVAAHRGDSIDTWMLRWRTLAAPEAGEGDPAVITQMRTVSDQLNDKINQGYATRQADPDFIRNTIIAMSQGARAYDNNLPRLTNSGELAVKVLIDILRSPQDRQYNATARRALRDLGRKALSPLVAATEMKDYDTLLDVVSALGDLGYDPAIPYLARLAASPEVPDGIHVAARRALARIGASDASINDPAEAFFRAAEKFYYGKSSISPSGDKIAYIWYWSDQDGLTKLDVPTPIFDDAMAMRSCEYALKLDPTKGVAVSLWLDANTKREADLPVGAVDPSHKDAPDAHYYNTSSGVKYLNSALARALRDRNAAVAFKLTQALQDIVGQSNLSFSSNEPVIQALFFPNRQVRYQAAFALAEALPTQAFPGSDRVVPLLAAALSQTSKLNVLIVAPADNDQLNGLRSAVQSMGYPMVSATDPTQGATAAAALSTIDLILISEDSDVGGMIDLAQTTTQLQGAPILVLTRSGASPYVVRSATDPLLSTVLMPPKEKLVDTLKIEIPNALRHSGTPAMTDEQASAYARRAATLLANLAIARGQALDLSAAEDGTLKALSDSRADIAEAAGRVLGMLDSQSAQNGLADKAIDDQTPADVRVSFFKSLANSAKFYGNRLDSGKVSQIETIVAQEKNSDVRAAAAEARGALNLPADQARTLILAQSKM
jgi:hypothetical protein